MSSQIYTFCEPWKILDFTANTIMWGLHAGN